MLIKLANFLARKLVDQENETQKNIVSYAILVLMLNLITLLMLLVVSICGHNVRLFVTYVIFFIPLRIFVGGYHASSTGKCLFLTILFFKVIMILQDFVRFNKVMLFMIILMNFLLIIKYAPGEAGDYCLDDVTRRRNKYISVIIFIVESFICVIAYRRNSVVAIQIVLWITYSSILLLVLYIRNIIEGYRS